MGVISVRQQVGEVPEGSRTDGGQVGTGPPGERLAFEKSARLPLLAGLRALGLRSQLQD
jgi:hypothetical protein